jgi:malate dehydrogenase (oxaloacetate-decarboxylating)
MAAAEGIAAIVGDDLREDYVIPSAFNRDVAPAVADAVAREARRSGWAEADSGEFGYAQGDTTEFRAIRS